MYYLIYFKIVIITTYIMWDCNVCSRICLYFCCGCFVFQRPSMWNNLPAVTKHISAAVKEVFYWTVP